jgi:hypothetical protein
MKESIRMADYDGFPWRSQKIEKTQILPLRWISNWLSNVAIGHLTKAIQLSEANNYGWKNTYHTKMWVYLYMPYQKWGTTYSLNMNKLEDWVAANQES